MRTPLLSQCALRGPISLYSLLALLIALLCRMQPGPPTPDFHYRLYLDGTALAHRVRTLIQPQ
ncbi:hypothetical protein [Ktedonobacter sp. SOSP1-85]|uniref:hypothetical protein n=1 Tax=Ktedonobacter sp. SOSP1-85 TaxID=2778367 RepID=UPI001916379C|nr:hypothetical protein [Ktedonobacter sp. SOSP1-85]